MHRRRIGSFFLAFSVAAGAGCDGGEEINLVVVCGNNALDPGEDCDDGNGASGDGCTPLCRLEPGSGADADADADGDGDGDSDGDADADSVAESDTDSGTVADPSLVGYWRLDGNADDSSGYGNHGTVHGAGWAANRDGTASAAVGLDGINDWIGIGHSDSLQTVEDNDSLTIAAWVDIHAWYPDPQVFAIFEKVNAVNNGNAWLLELWPSGGLCFNARFDTLQCFDYPFAFDGWYHLSVTYDASAGEVTFYANGAPLGAAPLSGPLADTGVTPVRIGRSVFGVGGGCCDEYSDGLIDDVRLYNRALSADEVATVFLGD